ncbi:Uncharacterised protein [Neisseria zoodegmatis]|uniref:Uncharacterized protein n=1 Tax=Neisseria zoodegmatis TaxID=326523 RepID=A0A378WG41_9NEIS|nr:hypothetical protein [Neisseria zoodegmatis]SUA36428.1 Uncharacterised protein [Neisseria zoodegmatis]
MSEVEGYYMCLNYDQCPCQQLSFDISKYTIVNYHKGSGNTSAQKSKFCISDETQLILFANMARNKWYETINNQVSSFGIYINGAKKPCKVGNVSKSGDTGDVCIIEYDTDMCHGNWHAYPSSGKGEPIPIAILEKWHKSGYIDRKQFTALNKGQGLYL